VIKESAEEVASGETKSALKEWRKHHDFVCVGCWDAFIGGRMPLQHRAIREKVIHDEFAGLILIRKRRLEEVQMQGSHGWGEESR
jgi:hypothetical protein